jgi:hypothetical protein
MLCFFSQTKVQFVLYLCKALSTTFILKMIYSSKKPLKPLAA